MNVTVHMAEAQIIEICLDYRWNHSKPKTVKSYEAIFTKFGLTFGGKDLEDLDLINKYGIQVLAIKNILQDQLNMIPTGKCVLKNGDTLILLGPNNALDLFREKEE